MPTRGRRSWADVAITCPPGRVAPGPWVASLLTAIAAEPKQPGQIGYGCGASTLQACSILGAGIAFPAALENIDVLAVFLVKVGRDQGIADRDPYAE